MDDHDGHGESLRERYRRARLRPPDTPSAAGGESREGMAGRPQPVDMSPAVPPPAPPAPAAGEAQADFDTLEPGVLGAFIAETRDDLQELHRDLLQLERHLDEDDTLREMGRLSHKIKGSAATFGYDLLAAVAHSFEDMLQAVYARRAPASDHDLTLLGRGLNLLTACHEAATAGSAPDARLATEAAQLEQELRSGQSALDPSAHPVEDTTPLFASDSWRTTHPVEHEAMLRVDVRRLDGLMARVSSLATNRALLARLRQDIARYHQELSAALVRVKAASEQVGDWQPLSSGGHLPAGRREEQTGAFLHPPLPSPLLPSSEPEANPASTWPAGVSRGSGMAAGTAAVHALDRDGELDQALRVLAEAVEDVTASSSGLGTTLQRFGHAIEAMESLMTQMQREVAAIRLIPLSELVPRLHLAVRQLANEQGKAVDFVVRGEATQIDRDICEALAEPLLQLVRNAVAHGVESPAERRDAGKPERGRVWLHASHDGNEASIEVGDDGCGIDSSLLIGAAISAGMFPYEAGRTLSEAEALDLMFVHGITTLATAGVAAGHGIGLDEVRNVVERLRGTITVTSNVGRGTVFRIRVPISLSVLNVLHVAAAGGAYAVPFATVRHTFSVSGDDVYAATALPSANATGSVRMSRRVRVAYEHVSGDSGDLSTRNMREEVPALALAELLGYEYQPRYPQPALVLEVGQRRIVLLVDVIFDEHEVVVQALPAYLRRRGVRGATVTLDGQVLLLLDVAELADGVIEGRRGLPVARPAPRFARASVPRVLVVDDSISMRGALESLLARAGYDVQVARDGFEALGLLVVSLPQVMILDLEMPRLDGFGLLKVLRGAPQFAGVRVAVLTSKASEKHRAQAQALGADEYLIKPCPEGVLLAAIERLLGGPTAAR